MDSQRNTYLISRALKNFVAASILTAATAQLASTMDAIVLAQFVSQEAMSALSLVVPVTTFISCLGLLMSFGANALAAKAIGRHDLKRASVIFSTAVWSILSIGLFFSLLICAGVPVIMDVMTDEPALRTLPAEYLRVYSLGAWLEMLSYALCLFVATDGHPRLVTLAVSVGALVNVVVDVLAVAVFGWGIQGIAAGTLAQYAVNVLILSRYFRRPACSYRLIWPRGRWWQLWANMKDGAPVTISNILMSVSILLIGNICYDALGERGFFFWSVCLQMLLISAVFINGVMEALFSIGGIMLGEHDLKGLNLLARCCLTGISLPVALLIAVMWIPDVVGILFGVENPEEMARLNHALRVYSPYLLCFALTLILVAVYQVLERKVLSIVTVVSQLALVVAAARLFACHAPGHVWYAFPLTGGFFLGCQLLYTYIYSRKHGCRVSGLTLIPYSEGGHTLDSSVRYSTEDVTVALRRIERFLLDQGIDKSVVFSVMLCCEELMVNIVQHSTGHIVSHTFDVHVFVKDGMVQIAVKDGGRPFDPIARGKAAKLKLVDDDIPDLGVSIAANIVSDISYKYMYGQNMVLIKV